MSAMPVSRRPHRNAAVRTLPDTSVGNLASAVVSTDIPTTCSRPNPGTGSLRHSVLGPKDVGMSMLRSIDGALVRADTKVPSPFNRRAVGVSGGYPPETDRQRFSRPGTRVLLRGKHKTRHHCRAKSASTSAVADAVFAAVFVDASAVAVWPTRCTVAVKRGACAGPSVRNS
ncbi:hypothetical protein [Rhodococcus sp. WAY2]|uniref:hypothetical protein n=1 Tax=Rhodococcus sp. WAY2 TaxID=2663121 RepID=UPI001358CEBE|nr:hypothetical protein [Rhodococcus sp. WAY2]